MEALMDGKLSGVHTAYLAKVLSISGRTAKIQPLGLYEDADGTKKAQSVLTKVPIAKSVRTSNPSVSFSCPQYEGNDEDGPRASCNCWQPRLSVGDIAVCICCEQNISEAKRGVNALPPSGRFSMSDSIIIGFL